MENTKTLQTLQNGNIDNQKSVTTEGTGTVLKELNLQALYPQQLKHQVGNSSIPESLQKLILTKDLISILEDEIFQN